MIRMLFVRHGATAGNLQKRYIGRTDEPLCPEGIAQIEQLSMARSWDVNQVFVSPMLRTRQTAQLLFADIPQQIVEDFREIDFGLFEGKTARELACNTQYQQWVDSMCLGPIPEGETPSVFKQRCCTAFLKLLPSIPDDTTVAFVVHGGVIMSILEQFALPKRNFYEYHLPNGSFYEAAFQQGCLLLN